MFRTLEAEKIIGNQLKNYFGSEFERYQTDSSISLFCFSCSMKAQCFDRPPTALQLEEMNSKIIRFKVD